MKLTTVVLAAIAAGAGMGGPATAAPLGVAPMLQYSNADTTIERVFRSALKREPTGSELRRYRTLMEDYNWTEADVRRDLRERPDYQQYSTNRSMRPETIIRRAYQDILGREPDPEGLRTYRSNMVDRNWSEQDVREALRNSPEYSSGAFRTNSADRIIRRAYQDILGREPDPSGLETYRRNIVERGWDEQDVRTALRKSDERRGAVASGQVVRGQATRGQINRGMVSDAAAADMVRRAYLSVLNREPDATGMNDYKIRVLRDHWTEQQIVDALRNSDEYRVKHQ
jgi:TorA maturation chaperone TorD